LVARPFEKKKNVLNNEAMFENPFVAFEWEVFKAIYAYFFHF